jgi:hypothetical protein
MEFVVVSLFPQKQKELNKMSDKQAHQKLKAICEEFSVPCFCPSLISFQMTKRKRRKFVQIVRGRRKVLSEELRSPYIDDWWNEDQESLLHYARRAAAGKVSVSKQQFQAGMIFTLPSLLLN